MDLNRLWCVVGTETEVVVVAADLAEARRKARELLFELSGDEDIVETLPFERHSEWSRESQGHIDFAREIHAQAVAAEREAFRAEVERRTPYALNMVDLLAWLDERSKDGAK